MFDPGWSSSGPPGPRGGIGSMSIEPALRSAASSSVFIRNNRHALFYNPPHQGLASRLFKTDFLAVIGDRTKV